MSMVHSGQEAVIPGETEAASGSVCRNCAGIEWVCENHQDRPWNEIAEFGCECGAGAPCPVCNKEMACAGRVFVATDPLKKTVADLLDALRTKRDYVSDVVDGFNKITPAIHEMAREDLVRIDAAIRKATSANSVGMSEANAPIPPVKTGEGTHPVQGGEG